MYVCMYYYTPVLLNLANNKQATSKKQQASNTFAFRFGCYSVPPLGALLYFSHFVQ